MFSISTFFLYTYFFGDQTKDNVENALYVFGNQTKTH